MNTDEINVRCTHPHFCPEWDEMFITPLMPEFEVCCCYCCGVGATKLSDFIRLEPAETEQALKYLKWLREDEQKQEEKPRGRYHWRLQSGSIPKQ